MTAIHRLHADEPGAWTRADIGGKADVFSLDLSAADRGELDTALAAVRARGLAMEAIGRADFPLPGLGRRLAALAREVADGRGLALVRGFPVEEYGQADIEALYWGLATHLCTAVSQSVMGDRLGHVIDVTDEDPNARAYRARRRLYFHSDFVDVLGLMCLCKGRSGGLNQFVSSLAVHNVILATRPELLEPLCRGFHYHRLGEEGPGEAPITPCRVPVFSVADGRLSARYSRTYLGEGVRAHGELSPFEAEALAYFDEVCLRLDLVAELGLEPGEGVFINNFTILHGRDAFEDGPDPARKRHLLRVWLAVEDGRPLVPEIQVFDAGQQGGIPEQEEGRTPSFERQAALDGTTTPRPD